jgi:hypothetical protein
MVLGGDNVVCDQGFFTIKDYWVCLVSHIGFFIMLKGYGTKN